MAATLPVRNPKQNHHNHQYYTTENLITAQQTNLHRSYLKESNVSIAVCLFWDFVLSAVNWMCIAPNTAHNRHKSIATEMEPHTNDSRIRGTYPRTKHSHIHCHCHCQGNTPLSHMKLTHISRIKTLSTALQNTHFMTKTDAARVNTANAPNPRFRNGLKSTTLIRSTHSALISLSPLLCKAAVAVEVKFSLKLHTFGMCLCAHSNSHKITLSPLLCTALIFMEVGPVQFGRLTLLRSKAGMDAQIFVSQILIFWEWRNTLTLHSSSVWGNQNYFS